MEPHILILGAPGAGKGTQSDNIVSEFGVEHVTTGDALRANKEMDIGHLGLEYDTPGEYMDQGELVPDEVVNEIVDTALDEADGYVLDGYPRNLDQAETLSEMTDLDVVLYLDVDEEVLVERLTGRRLDPETGDIYHVEFDMPDDEAVRERLVQREDDTEETVRERIRVYHENTEPVVEFYDERGDLIRIDGEQTPDEVWEDVKAAIEENA
ncbi:MULTISPECIES: adenylate kinase [Halorussus]|uniref:adenylate kinase n=1 Tax=Halorussus TaxID=1070314 RepID=UPI0020A0CAB9|nr:adenylate kinase [Halorussus vallis]USZ77067.1 adenylate kinase [Halorussus vallis]